MRARELMTTSVVHVAPTAPVPHIARTLLDHGISAVPVVDDGIPVGVVSEGDVVSRCGSVIHSRRDWFVRLLAGDGTPHEFLSCAERTRTAREIMTAPVITTTEDTRSVDISRLMLTHRIKRIPVVRGGRMVGIVSRADLLRVVAYDSEAPAEGERHSALAEVLLRIDRAFHARAGRADGHDRGPAPQAEPEPIVSADELRATVARSKEHEMRARAEERRRRREQSLRDVESMLAAHLTDEAWHHMLLDAQHAAERGEREMQLLRMPHEACTDNGRMINVCEPGWPSTLRGEAAELWRRWDRELRPRGLRLTARTLDYPDGVPGDIGLFLVWGE